MSSYRRIFCIYVWTYTYTIKPTANPDEFHWLAEIVETKSASVPLTCETYIDKDTYLEITKDPSYKVINDNR